MYFSDSIKYISLFLLAAEINPLLGREEAPCWGPTPHLSSTDSKSAFNRLFFLYFSDMSHRVFLWLYKIYFSLRLTLCWGGRSAMLRADPRSIIIISSAGKRPSLKYTRLGHLSSSFHQHILVSTKPSLMSTKVCTFNKHPDKSYEHTAAMVHFVCVLYSSFNLGEL